MEINKGGTPIMQGQNNVKVYDLPRLDNCLKLVATTLISSLLFGCDVTTSFEPKEDATNECVIYANDDFNATLSTNGELTISTER